MAEILDVVNEKDEVIGRAEREDVHKKGLTCRIVYVLFFTPNYEVILQRRSKTKKSSPGRLTTTVSGHVESGSSYDETAIKETFEETGIAIDPSKLTKVGVEFQKHSEGDYISHAMRAVYTYEFNGDMSELKIEDGEGAGFEKMTINDLKRKIDTEPDEFALFLRDSVKIGLIGTIVR